MTGTTLDQRFADAMGQLLGPDFPSDIGLAVSGGGDSMAMLYLAHNWTRTYGVRLWVMTVDHQLRDESAEEAKMVAEECAALGWPHATLRWSWDGQGNVQDAGRRARLRLIDQWRGIVRHVLMAHTQDDQAETVLMRLIRGSGVDGLAGMRAQRHVCLQPKDAKDMNATDLDGHAPPCGSSDGYTILRPCLEMTRSELRHYARVLKGRWVEDPSNDNPNYERVRVRQLLAHLSADGLTPDSLTDTARRMTRAKAALDARLREASAALCVEAPLGQVRIARDGFALLDAETQMRMLSASLCYVASTEYRPREYATEALLERLLSGGGGTLHGAEAYTEKDHIRVVREWSAVRTTSASVGRLWDDQWVLTSQTAPTQAQTRALGEEGWRQAKAAVATDVPHKAALALPSLWLDEVLIACPGLGVGLATDVTRYVLGRVDTGFGAFCLSH